MNLSTSINGQLVYTDLSLVIQDGYKTINRSWKERLLTFHPWNPFKKTKKVSNFIPDPTVYQTKTGLIMHPATLKTMRKSLN